MRLPRWIVVSLLIASVVSVIAVIGYGGWWWFTWPERTAREFVELIATKRFDEANRITTFAFESKEFPPIKLQRHDWWKDPKLDCQSRTLRDVLVGSQEFGLGKAGYDFKFTVKSGQVFPSNSTLCIIMEQHGAVVIGPERLRFITPDSQEQPYTFPLGGGGVGSIHLPTEIGNWMRILKP
jgi:hypothetical protein